MSTYDRINAGFSGTPYATSSMFTELNKSLEQEFDVRIKLSYGLWDTLVTVTGDTIQTRLFSMAAMKVMNETQYREKMIPVIEQSKNT